METHWLMGVRNKTNEQHIASYVNKHYDNSSDPAVHANSQRQGVPVSQQPTKLQC